MIRRHATDLIDGMGSVRAQNPQARRRSLWLDCRPTGRDDNGSGRGTAAGMPVVSTSKRSTRHSGWIRYSLPLAASKQRKRLRSFGPRRNARPPSTRKAAPSSSCSTGTRDGSGGSYRERAVSKPRSLQVAAAGLASARARAALTSAGKSPRSTTGARIRPNSAFHCGPCGRIRREPRWRSQVTRCAIS